MSLRLYNIYGNICLNIVKLVKYFVNTFKYDVMLHLWKTCVCSHVNSCCIIVLIYNIINCEASFLQPEIVEEPLLCSIK